MRLYLSSYRIGNHGDRLLELLPDGARAFVIGNGLDGARASTRETVLGRTFSDLAELGIEARELDLRESFNDSLGLDHLVQEADLVWACGGNAFTLAMAMDQSGFAGRLREWLDADRIVYAGYSAGAVVAGSTLRGIELVDSADPQEAVPLGYRPDILWTGLGLVPYAVVPHYRSDHWESEKIEAVVRLCVAEGIPHRTMRDGEVILIDGDTEEFLPA